MSRPRSVVIVGAGRAGAKAGETLREQRSDGRVALLGAEAVHLPAAVRPA